MLLMGADPLRQFAQQRMAMAADAQGVGAAVVRRVGTLQQAARLEPVDQRHQGRPVDAQRLPESGLAEARIAIDNGEDSEQPRCQIAGADGAGEMLEYRKLGFPQMV